MRQKRENSGRSAKFALEVQLVAALAQRKHVSFRGRAEVDPSERGVCEQTQSNRNLFF